MTWTYSFLAEGFEFQFLLLKDLVLKGLFLRLHWICFWSFNNFLGLILNYLLLRLLGFGGFPDEEV
jgi:hypothetical protein